MHKDKCLCCLVRVCVTEILVAGKETKRTKAILDIQNIPGCQHSPQSPSGVDVTGASMNVCFFVCALYLLTHVHSDLSGLLYQCASLCKCTFNPCIFVNQQSKSEHDRSVCTTLCLCVCVPGAGCVTRERVCSRSRRGRGR